MSETEHGLTVVRAGTIDFTGMDIEALKRLPELLNTIYKSVLQEGTDYGRIPGTPKPSLWKPGAEILSRWLSMAPDLLTADVVEKIEPTDPYFAYRVECRLYGKDGYLGNGFGSANSREPGFAFRWVSEKYLPKDVDKATAETRSVKNYLEYRVLTPPNEIFGVANTILKRASKRAFVEAVLRVTGASRIFTQDLEDEGVAEAVAKSKDVTPEAKVTPPVDQKPTPAVEEVQFFLREDHVDVRSANGQVQVFPVASLMLDTDGFGKLKMDLEGQYGADSVVWIPREKGGPYFAIGPRRS
jgi:hypothetical protein